MPDEQYQTMPDECYQTIPDEQYQTMPDERYHLKKPYMWNGSNNLWEKLEIYIVLEISVANVDSLKKEDK